MSAARCAVVGVGTPDRQDDAVGLLVAERVARHPLAGLDVVPVRAPLDLLDVCEGYDTVIVVDGLRSGVPPGSVTVRAVTHAPLPTSSAGGTHGFGVAEVLELARALDRLPPRLVLVGVELEGDAVGEPVTAAVRAGTGAAVEAVLALAREALGAAASGEGP